MINNILCSTNELFFKPFEMEVSPLGSPDLSFYIFAKTNLGRGLSCVRRESERRGGMRRGKGGPGAVYISCLLT